jgi:hypothetical protein
VSDKLLYQVRLKASNDVADALRFNTKNTIAKKICQISKKNKLSPICTLDAFEGYVEEAEKNGVEKYPLYKWTKDTVSNPEKRLKHAKSFAFYLGVDQVYSKSIALTLFEDLLPLYKTNKEIEDLRLIDTNPKNNPQPPKQ